MSISESENQRQMTDVERWDDVHRIRQWGTCPETIVARWAMRTWRAHMDSTNMPYLLDVGCGVGPNAKWLASEGFIVDGLDASVHAIRRAKSHNQFPFSTKFRVGTLPEALEQAPANRYDGAFDVCCLQHVGDLKRSLRAIHRVIKPGGSFLSVMANTEHDLTVNDPQLQDATFRLVNEYEVDKLFGPDCFTVSTLQVDKITRTDGPLTISHWIIQATK